MTIKIMYPYDPSRTNDECLIEGESHILTTNDNDFRVLVPEMAPFFSKDLKVVHAVSGLELRENKDYYLGGELISAEVIASLPLYSYLCVTNKALLGEFILTYGTVGHTYVGIRSNVLTYLANVLNDPVRTPLDKVLERPVFYLPHRHDMHWSDSINKEGLTAGLANLVSKIDNDAPQALTAMLTSLNATATTFTNDLNATGYTAHVVDEANPHATTAAQVDALPLAGTAIDSFKAFNRDLVTLSNYVNTRGIVQADIDKYVDDRGSRALTGKILLKDGVAKIRNSSSDIVIDLSSGNIKLLSKGAASFAAKDTDIQLASGLNDLTIVQSGDNTSFSAITFNMHVVYTEMTLKAALLSRKPARAAVVTANTPTIDFSGSGLDSSNLSATLKLSVATLTTRGTVKRLSDDYNEVGTDTAPTANVMRKLRILGESYVPMSRKINGKPLTADINLTKADIGLGNVDNTSDLEKPVSIPQRDYLDTFAAGNHGHHFNDIDWDTATPTVTGLTRLVSSPTDPIVAGGAATPGSVLTLNNKAVEVQTALDNKLSRNVLSVGYWKPLVSVTTSDLTVTIPGSCMLYMDRIDYENGEGVKPSTATLNLATLFPNGATNTTIHFYIENQGAGPFYMARKDLLDNDVGRLFLFSVVTDTTAISQVVRPGIAHRTGSTLVVTTFPSVGKYRELAEHIADLNSHLSTASGGSTGTIPDLSNVSNLPFARGASAFSDASMQSWEMFSGSAQALGTLTWSDTTLGAKRASKLNYAQGTVCPVALSKARLLDIAAYKTVAFNVKQRKLSWQIQAAPTTDDINVMLFSNKLSNVSLDWLGVSIRIPSATRPMEVSLVRNIANVNQTLAKVVGQRQGNTLRLGTLTINVISSDTTPNIATVIVTYASIVTPDNTFASVTLYVDLAQANLSGSATTYIHKADGLAPGGPGIARDLEVSTGINVPLTQAIRDLITTGTFGLGFITATNTTPEIHIQMTGAFETGKDQYISAKAITDYLKSANNIHIVTGTTVGPVGISGHGNKALILWSTSNFTGNGTNVIGVEGWMYGSTTGRVTYAQLVDLTESVDYPHVMSRVTRQGMPDVTAVSNYMTITFTDY